MANRQHYKVAEVRNEVREVIARAATRDALKAMERTAADDESLRQYFAGLDADHLRDIAFRLYKDAERLRRELDDANGVIR